MERKVAGLAVLVALLGALSLTDAGYAGVGKTISLIEQKLGGPISVSGQADGEVLTWDATAGAWVASAAGGGGGDITAVNAGTGLSGGGASGDVTLNVSGSLADISAITTQLRGSVLVYGDGEWLQVGVGANNEVLTADDTLDSGVKWAAIAAGTDDQTLAEVLTEGNTMSDGQQILADVDPDPAYSFSGDLDSGLLSTAGDTVGVMVGGTEELRVTANQAQVATDGAFTFATGAVGTANTHQLHKNSFGDLQLAGATKETTFQDLWLTQIFNSVTGDPAGSFRRWLRTGSRQTIHSADWQIGWSTGSPTFTGGTNDDVGFRRDASGSICLGDMTQFTTAGGGYGTATVHVTHLESGVTGAVAITISNLVPANRWIWGVTSSVQTALGTTNGLTGVDIGDGTDQDAYVAALGTAKGSRSDWDDATAAPGRPRFVTASEDVVLTPIGGTGFDGSGDIRITVHFANIVPPFTDEAGNPH